NAPRLWRRPVVAPPSVGESGEPGGQRGGHGAGTVAAARVGRNRGDRRVRPLPCDGNVHRTRSTRTTDSAWRAGLAAAPRAGRHGGNLPRGSGPRALRRIQALLLSRGGRALPPEDGEPSRRGHPV